MIEAMEDKSYIGEDRRAAILCAHVAKNGLPILRAVRDEPTMPEDSGWQFLCGVGNDEDPDQAEVWLVCEVLELEPSLNCYIQAAPGTVLTRQDTLNGWELSRKG